MKKFITICAIVLFAVNIASAVTTADIMFVVDESGSMGGEHVWLGPMVGSLDTALIGEGLTGNQYALVGYGTTSHGTDQRGHKHSVGGGDWETAAQFATETSNLVTTGSTEDGWEAIHFGLNNYAFRASPDVGCEVIMVTDEGRDDNDGGLGLT